MIQVKVLYANNNITPIKTNIPKCIGSDNQVFNAIFLSPLLNFRLEKGNNYKNRNINYNCIDISESSQRNFSFSNTNKNLIDYSLNNFHKSGFVNLCVCESIFLKISKKIRNNFFHTIIYIGTNIHINKNKVYLFSYLCENKSHKYNKSISYVHLKYIFLGGIC